VALKAPPKSAAHDSEGSDDSSSQVPLLADDEVPSSAPEESPIKVDPSLLSENAIYSDAMDDPRAELRRSLSKRNKPASARTSSSGLIATDEESKPAEKGSARMTKTSARSSGLMPSTGAADEPAPAPEVSPSRGSQRSIKPGSARSSSAGLNATESSPKSSARMSKTSARSSALLPRTETPDGSSSRRSTRSSMVAAKKPLSLKHKIGAGVLVFTVLVVLGGYDPFMRHWHTTNLDTAATVEERKSAASALVSRYQANALETFQTRFRSTDPLLREASVHGMSQVALTVKGTRKDIIKALSSEVPNANTPGKILYLDALASISQSIVKSAAADKSPDDQAALISIAETLIPVTDSVETKLEVRQAAVDALCTLRVKGVCKQLVKLATSDKDLKEKARRGIAGTALPDSAGDLLRAAAGTDKELANEAKRAFVTIRDQAKSEDILPLVGPEQPEDVRREIIEALGKRRDDPKAQQGITIALSDPKPEMRILALKAVPITGVSDMKKLGELIKDPEESVRLANAEILSVLRDGESQKIVLEAFKNDLPGKTMDAYIGALAKRVNRKDLPSINMIVGLFDTNPAAQGSLCKALVQLTLADGGKQREQERTAWGMDKWKVWHARITEREQLRTQAKGVIATVAKQRDASRTLFPKFYEQTKAAVESLEKCIELCKPDDVEDIKTLEAELLSASRQKDYFFKGSGV